MNKFEVLNKIKNKEDKILCSFILDKYNEHRKKNITTYSYFLDDREINIVKPVINKLCNNYFIYYPHDYCEKGIIIFGNPSDIKIRCLKVNNDYKLKHQDYLGSLFSLGIDRHVIGDIIIDENIAYIFILDKIKNFILSSWFSVGNKKIEVNEINIKNIIIHKEKFLNLELNVTSNRIDVVISRLINKSRKDVNDWIKKGKVLINYNILKKNSYVLNQNDVFSIRGYGKYIYRDIINKTKKGNLIILIDKYN